MLAAQTYPAKGLVDLRIVGDVALDGHKIAS